MSRARPSEALYSCAFRGRKLPTLLFLSAKTAPCRCGKLARIAGAMAMGVSARGSVLRHPFPSLTSPWFSSCLRRAVCGITSFSRVSQGPDVGGYCLHLLFSLCLHIFLFSRWFTILLMGLVLNSFFFFQGYKFSFLWLF